jgi:hypothetical protein
MEVSETVLSGQELLDTLGAMTGLPEEQIHGELQAILSRSGFSQENLTLDQFRLAMAAYLEHVFDACE